MKFRNLMLKSIPYILSVLGGLVVYIVSVDTISDQNLNGLISNIAASLLAIPLIFILYDYVNWKMSNTLNEKMAESLIFDVNSIVLKALKILRHVLMPKQALSWQMIEKMARMRAREIRKSAKITDADIAAFKSCKKELNELSYKLVRSGILSDQQIQMVISITKELAHIVNEWEYKGNTVEVSKYIENLLDAIDDWFDSVERQAVKSHQQFQLTIGQESGKASKKI